MRENVQRRIVVQSNVSGRDLRSVVNDIQARVGAERPAAAGLSRRVRRPVRERGAGVAAAALAVARRDRRDLLHPVGRVRLVARRPADHAQPAARADRRRRWASTWPAACCRSRRSSASSRCSASPRATASCWSRTSATCRSTKASPTSARRSIRGATERLVPDPDDGAGRRPGAGADRAVGRASQAARFRRRWRW